jgi:hypothetical protein
LTSLVLAGWAAYGATRGGDVTTRCYLRPGLAANGSTTRGSARDAQPHGGLEWITVLRKPYAGDVPRVLLRPPNIAPLSWDSLRNAGVTRRGYACGEHPVNPDDQKNPPFWLVWIYPGGHDVITDSYGGTMRWSMRHRPQPNLPADAPGSHHHHRPPV